MIIPGIQKYDVVLQGNSFLREAVESITTEDNLGEVACRTTIKLTVPGDQFTGLPIIKPGHELQIIGTKFGSSDIDTVFNAGAVWDVSISNQQRRHWNIVLYDRSINMAKSEDEYYFAAGTTATQRIHQIAKDWNIPILSLPDTGQPLAKAFYRARNIWSIIMEALQETAEKSGKLYRLRMMPGTIETNPKYKFKAGGLELVELGKNDPVWAMDFASNLESISQRQTLDGAVTKVKILGNAPRSTRPQVVGVVAGEVDKYGTLQKILAMHKSTDTGEAMSVAKHMLGGVMETIDAVAVDINTIRAGDRVYLDGYEDLFVISVKHDYGSPGRMSLQLAGKEHIRRRYYARKSV